MKCRLLVLWVVLLAAACADESGTGICPGQMTGGYFELVIVNYVDDAFDVSMNGRPVGKVSGYTPGAPAVSSTEEFPTCDAHVLRLESEQQTYQFCSNAQFNQCAAAPTTTCRLPGKDQEGCCALPIRVCEEYSGDDCGASDGSMNPSAAMPTLNSPVCGCDVAATWTLC